MIVFDTNLRAVLGHDVVHDRQPQAGAAALGGEVGQEELLLSSGEMPQPVSAIVSSTVSAAAELRWPTIQPLHQRLLHGFGGVVDQVHHHALELLAIDVYRRQSGRAGP